MNMATTALGKVLAETLGTTTGSLCGGVPTGDEAALRLVDRADTWRALIIIGGMAAHAINHQGGAAAPGDAA